MAHDPSPVRWEDHRVRGCRDDDASVNSLQEPPHLPENWVRRGWRATWAAQEADAERGMIDEDPTGFYDEYAVLLSRELNKSVSVPTVYRYMTRDLKYSRKKLHKIAQERRVDLRAAFLRGISEQGLRPAQLVFVDETSKDDRTARRTYAYGPVGVPVRVKMPAFRGVRYSCLAAISWEGGVLGYGTVEVG